MFEHMEKLKVINALYGVSGAYKEFTRRPYHALIFKIDGQSEYTFSSRKMLLSAGQVLFVPQGENYTVRCVSPAESHYALVNFAAELPDAAPRLYDCGSFDGYRHILDRLIRVSLSDSVAGRFEMLSLFYKGLSLLHQRGEKSYCDSGKMSLLKPAADYLERNIFDPGLKVGQLHTVCGISDTYFRRIFTSLYGVSPKKYVLRKRLLQAKNILDSGEYTHIYEVAAAVGFEDALYFGKLFKSQYGYFPSKNKGID